jgi:CxxC-x17-CxxC domain-containing protein
MDGFNKGKRFGGNRSFGGGSGFGGNRDNSRQGSFKATCSDCGAECELPFKPTGDRPVYCSNCFKKQSGGAGKPGGFDRGQRRERPRFDDKQMYDAVCGKCGAKCQVPFRPTPGKQVFCDRCFDKGGVSGGKGGSDYAGQFKTLNEKLDKLIKLLSPSAPVSAPEKTLAKIDLPEKKSVKSKPTVKDKKITDKKKTPIKKKIALKTKKKK